MTYWLAVIDDDGTRIGHVPLDGLDLRTPAGSRALANATRRLLGARRVADCAHRAEPPTGVPGPSLAWISSTENNEQWRCLCGNTDGDAGFRPCGEDRSPVAPIGAGSWLSLYLCLRCGRIIDAASTSRRAGRWAVAVVSDPDPTYPTGRHGSTDACATAASTPARRGIADTPCWRGGDYPDDI